MRLGLVIFNHMCERMCGLHCRWRASWRSRSGLGVPCGHRFILGCCRTDLWAFCGLWDVQRAWIGLSVELRACVLTGCALVVSRGLCHGFRMSWATEPWAFEIGMRDVNVEGVTDLVCNASLLLPQGFNITALLECVKLLIKHNVELWRDMTGLGVENQCNGL